MPKDINDISKEIQKVNQDLGKSQKELTSIDHKFSKEMSDIKKMLKSLERKIDIVVEKIQEFEIIMDAAEIIEEHIADEEDKYNTEWNPYEDDDYEGEEYDKYDDNDDE